MDNHLEIALRQIGSDLAWPDEPTAFSQRVVARIEHQPVPARVGFRKVGLVLGSAAIVAAALMTFSPATREAVADFVGLGGVRIQSVPKDRIPTAIPGSTLDLGEPVTLDEAQARVDFPILVPIVHGRPDQVFHERIEPADMVSLVYTGRTQSDVEILITQFEGELVDDEGMLKKLSATGTMIERVEVNGSEGYWLSGEPHLFYYRTGSDVVRDETVRLVENVLLWVQDGVTIRIETSGTLGSAVQIAESLR